MQALNGQNIGGLGTGSVNTPVTVGMSGLPGGSYTGAQGGTFTYGFGIDLAQIMYQLLRIQHLLVVVL